MFSDRVAVIAIHNYAPIRIATIVVEMRRGIVEDIAKV